MNLQRLVAAAAFSALYAAAEEPRPARRIVVSLVERKLVLLEGESVVKLYDIAVGKRSTPSPTGRFQVAVRVAHPTWYGPDRVVPPGKANPLGTRWLGLSAKGYGIHGTNTPKSIGIAASKGCIRMRNRDVEELFELVEVGDIVELETETPQWLAARLAVSASTGN